MDLSEGGYSVLQKKYSPLSYHDDFNINYSPVLCMIPVLSYN